MAKRARKAQKAGRTKKTAQGKGEFLIPDFSLTRFLVLLAFSPKVQLDFQTNETRTMQAWGLDADEQRAIKNHDVNKLRELFSTQSGDRAHRRASKKRK